MKELTGKMLQARKATPIGLSTDAWYYVGPTSIDVFVRADGTQTMSARLTRRQMKLALKIMDSVTRR